MARIIDLRERHDSALKVSETLQRTLAQGGKDIISQDERNCFFRVFVRSGNKETGVGEYSLIRLRET